MRNRIERFLETEKIFEILLVVLADRKGAVHGLAQRPVFVAHAFEAGECVESDDLAMAVERFEELAQEMGTRAWQRIIVLADRAVKKRKRTLAAAVFEAALGPGMHERFLREKYELELDGSYDQFESVLERGEIDAVYLANVERPAAEMVTVTRHKLSALPALGVDPNGRVTLALTGRF